MERVARWRAGEIAGGERVASKVKWISKYLNGCIMLLFSPTWVTDTNHWSSMNGRGYALAHWHKDWGLAGYQRKSRLETPCCVHGSPSPVIARQNGTEVCHFNWAGMRKQRNIWQVRGIRQRERISRKCTAARLLMIHRPIQKLRELNRLHGREGKKPIVKQFWWTI